MELDSRKQMSMEFKAHKSTTQTATARVDDEEEDNPTIEDNRDSDTSDGHMQDSQRDVSSRM